MLHPATDGSYTGFIPMGRNHHLVVPEQFFCPFIFVWLSTVGIPHQLIDTRFHWVGDVGRFTLNDSQWQTIHEQHNVGNDVLIESFNLELVGAEKFVVIWIFKINDFDGMTTVTFANILKNRLVADECFQMD